MTNRWNVTLAILLPAKLEQYAENQAAQLYVNVFLDTMEIRMIEDVTQNVPLVQTAP